MFRILLVSLVVSSAALAEEPGPDLSHCVEDSRFFALFLGFDRKTLNYGCAADAYQDAGMYEMAAKMRCKIDEIRHRFLEIEDCVVANTHIPLEEPPVAVTAVEERHEEDVQLLQQQVQQLENELAQVQKEEPPQAPVIVQQPFLSEKKKQALRDLKE